MTAHSLPVHAHSHGLVDASIKRSRAGCNWIANPLIGLAITLVILRITWQSWRTVRGGHHHPPEHA